MEYISLVLQKDSKLTDIKLRNDQVANWKVKE